MNELTLSLALDDVTQDLVATLPPPARLRFPSSADVIALHVPADILTYIDRAAVAAGKDRTAFMLDASMDAADNELVHKRCRKLTEADLAACHEILSRPLSENEGHQRLMGKRTPWET